MGFLDMVPRVSLGYFHFLYLSGWEVSKLRMRGVAASEVDWTSEVAPDLAEHPLNLVLHIHLRIFAYTWNDLIVGFE